MKQTSRNWLIDWVEYIGQLLAYCSHLQEIIDWYGQNDDISQDDYIWAIENIMDTVKDRRDAMQVIKDMYNGNEKIRCALKHSIFAYTLATEMLYANWDNKQIINLQRNAAYRMYRTLSKFINVEVVSCGRCLSEQIDLQNNIEIEWK